jgi:hypothetical protein
MSEVPLYERFQSEGVGGWVRSMQDGWVLCKRRFLMSEVSLCGRFQSEGVGGCVLREVFTAGVHEWSHLQGYLAHSKTPPPLARTPLGP